MSGKKDIVKGRIEEAAGVLTGRKDLRLKGREDQAVGRVKQAAARTANRLAKRARK